MVGGNDAPIALGMMVRWLLWPAVFVLAMWYMLFRPDDVLMWSPALWATGGKGLDEVLPPRPKTRVQTFDLGGLARHYKVHCDEASKAKGRRGAEVEGQCAETLRLAGEVVGWGAPLTPKQLLGMRDFLAELDAQKSPADRVMGFFSFINIIWLIAVLGIVGTVGPCVAYLLGPVLLMCGRALVNVVLVPLATFMHDKGIIEAIAYLLSLVVAAQGLRYPSAQAEAGMMVGFTGGLFIIPCWGYSTALHVKTRGGDQNAFIMLSNALIAAVLVPLAIMHDSRLIGFGAVLAVYGALGFMFSAFGMGFVIGFDSKAGLHRCLAASVFLVVAFVALRVLGVNPAFLRPFATGAMCLGNVMYFLAMLILSSKFHRGDYKVRNGLMLGSLLAALLVGSVYALPSMSNTACVFLVLWIMEKEFEVDWGGIGIVILFVNFVAMYFAAHYLHTHPELVTSMFDPEGLFVA